MKADLWAWYAAALLGAAVGYYCWRLWRGYRDRVRIPDEADQRAKAKTFYQRYVEKGWATDLEVPAFYREASGARRSRYIGRRAAVMGARWIAVPAFSMPEGTACSVCELPLDAGSGRMVRRQGSSWAHDKCVQP